MAPPQSALPKRLGRPPQSNSADTRRRILDEARAAFATGGYDASTNRELAEAVGLTTGALYHYFGSKLDLYVAVYGDLQEAVFGRFIAAAEAADGFVDQIDAVLDAAHEMNDEDTTLAAFVGMVRVDSRRHPEIADALGAAVVGHESFFIRLVDEAIKNGEVAKKQRKFVIGFVLTMLVGLTDGVSDDSDRHLCAATSIKMVLRGQLLQSE